MPTQSWRRRLDSLRWDSSLHDRLIPLIPVIAIVVIGLIFLIGIGWPAPRSPISVTPLPTVTPQAFNLREWQYFWWEQQPEP